VNALTSMQRRDMVDAGSTSPSVARVEDESDARSLATMRHRRITPMQRALPWIVLLVGCDPSVPIPLGDSGIGRTDAGAHDASRSDAPIDGAPPTGDAGCRPRETDCTLGADEDCDGASDCDDADCISDPVCVVACAPLGPEDSDATCSNDLDEDCDGAFDCADEDCQRVDLDACGGRYQRLDCWVQPTLEEVVDLEVELTADGFRTIARDWEVGTGFGEIELRGPRRVGTGDLVDEVNGRLSTCEHCALGRTPDGVAWFPRWGRMELDEVPSAVGEPLRGRLLYWLEEVDLVAGDAIPRAGGRCLAGVLPFRGVAVPGGVVASGSRPRSASGVGAVIGPLDLGVCGDAVCSGASEAACIDCGCVPEATRKTCPDGHTCPAGSSCLTHGRCACVEPPDVFVGGVLPTLSELPDDRMRFGVHCAGLIPCGDGDCGGHDWSCISPSNDI
jgi:hypothetical protein